MTCTSIIKFSLCTTGKLNTPYSDVTTCSVSFGETNRTAAEGMLFPRLSLTTPFTRLAGKALDTGFAGICARSLAPVANSRNMASDKILCK